MLQIHVVLCIWKSFEKAFLIAICRQSGDKWQSKNRREMAIENTISNDFYLRSLIEVAFLICRLSGEKI